MTANAKPPTAPTAKPAATSATKPDNLSGCTDVPCKPTRKVTYVFKFTADKNLKLPYAWAVNGVAGNAFKNKPSRTRHGEKIELRVQAGDTVTLYLNSDAHPDYRKQPVYAVTPSERDVVVTITEKAGKHSDPDTPKLQPKPKQPDASKAAATSSATSVSVPAAPAPATPATAAPAAKAVKAEFDEYTAPLTGDIWMKVSHKYSEAEALALTPYGTAAEVRDAVKRIYAGLTSTSLTVNLPATAEQAKRKVTAVFSDAGNPTQNITSFALFTDGLPRVHPAAFAAMFTAALESNVSRLEVSSNWRPLMGSISHRAGLGLDVTDLDDVSLNKTELLNKTANKNDNDGVTAEEHRLFKEYQAADQAADAATEAASRAGKELGAATAGLNKAKAALAAAKTPEAKAAAEAVVAERAEAVRLAKGARDEASEASKMAAAKLNEPKAAWEKQNSANEPEKVKIYRARLMKCRCVSQVFDPWFMDDAAQDKVAPTPNHLKGGNEFAHRHHLHITVSEPKIL